MVQLPGEFNKLPAFMLADNLCNFHADISFTVLFFSLFSFSVRPLSYPLPENSLFPSSLPVCPSCLSAGCSSIHRQAAGFPVYRIRCHLPDRFPRLAKITAPFPV
jgi:hypothetical protein